MKHTQKQLEEMSDFELSKIIAMMSKYSISFDINNWSNMGPLIDEIWSYLNRSAGTYTTWTDMMEAMNCGKLRAAAIVYILIKQGE